MPNQESKEKILSSIRLASKENDPIKTRIDCPEVFHIPEGPLEIVFAEELMKINGKFMFCMDSKELMQNLFQVYTDKGWDCVFCTDHELQKILETAGIPFASSQDEFTSMQVGINWCEFLIARTGSIMVSSGLGHGRWLTIFPPTSIVVAYTSQLVLHIGEAIEGMKKKYRGDIPSMISMISGPSRTADIEKTLVLGAHGPKELIVFLVNDSMY